MRRIVTGVDDAGRSCVLHDDEIAEPAFGAKIWQNDPKDVRLRIDAIGSQPVPVQPPAGGSLALWIRIPPQSSTETAPPQNGVDADGFHVTRTIDYVIVQSGEVTMLLDQTAITVGAGSLVVQRATRHAWRNLSDAPVVMLAILTTIPEDRDDPTEAVES